MRYIALITACLIVFVLSPGRAAFGNNGLESRFPSLKQSDALEVKKLAAKIFSYRIFEEPIIAVGGLGTLEESRDLEGVIKRFIASDNFEDLTEFENFLDRYPESVYRTSLLANLGSLSYQQGYFSRAISYWEQA